MPRSLPAPLGALCCVLMLIAPLAPADAPPGDDAVANDPATLADTTAAPVGEHAETQEDEATSSPAASESRALGVPNGILSARPAEVDAGDESAGPLAALDPRNNDLVRVFGALAIVLGLLVLVRIFFRRAGGGLVGASRPSGVLEILARYPVARGQHLVVLKMARRILLIHQSGGSMTTLSEMTDPDEVASLLARLEAGADSRHADRFRSVLKAFEHEHERLAGRGAPAHGRASRDAPEIIDLTRSQMKGLGGLLGRRRINA